MKNYSIGKQIKNLRTKNKLTQKKLGEALGFSAQTISDWENGNTEPNITAIIAMVKFFNITYDRFFESI